MRIFSVILVSFLLAGCIATPQTREEYVALMKEYSSRTLVDTYTTNRPFDEVTRALERKWNECYDVTKTTARGAMVSQISDSYHPHVTKVNRSLVEFTLQVTTTGMTSLNKVPPGGLYQVALDVQRQPGNKTKLSWYSKSGWTKSWDMNKQWSDGKNVPCRSE